MSYNHLLDLHLSQCEIFLHKSKNNNYSDTSKKIYQDKLFELFEKIKASIVPGIPESSVFEKQEHLNFIAKSLEFLKDSTLNSIPFEVVSCLSLAMNDWADKNEFIIVTSLNNNIEAYSYDESLAFEYLLYSSIRANYNIEFKKKLVQINLPLILSKDYFSSVILYHELGHFVDIKEGISHRITDEILKVSPTEWSKIQAFFPFPQNLLHRVYMQKHVAEYFCDIFASQYIGLTFNYYLKYIDFKNSANSSYTHPSTDNRIKVVEDYLKGTPNPMVEKIMELTFQVTGKKLKKRFEDINSKDFYEFVPLEIENSKQLHGIFSYAWQIWSKGCDNFKKSAKISSDLPSEKIYKILNNLIEKSIGNYFIKIDWKKAGKI